MYIGTPPSNAFTSLLKQDFSTSATTSYTLDHAVNNANDIALFINFVRQEPTAAYAASGTSLVLTSATASSDDMYCVYLGQALQTVNPPNASVGISQLSATGTKDATTFLRGDNTFASAGGDNTPSFLVYKNNSSQQSISHASWTKINFDSEDVDTANAFASDRFTVPSGQGGKYQINAMVEVVAGDNNLKVHWISIYKNGSSYLRSRIYFSSGAGNRGYVEPNFINNIMDLSASDYIEVYVYAEHQSGSSMTIVNSGASDRVGSYFSGYKLIGV